ncbi:hypothetical protein Sango_1993000 [Sesamum angolense]|uniref:Uncharacterized protein n=1 Tax=Sesamum angolense TaxID=2727404 RepID=A0AAE1WF13_9LAMI|nr:hypothetical protein Sango_1993000 [Sesamum angolense]
MGRERCTGAAYGNIFFGEIEDQFVFFKVFLRMKFMPFANVAPWVIGHDGRAGFIVVWFLSDLMLGFLFAVDSWIAIVDARRGGREIVKEGCHMLVAMFCPAFEIRWLEAITCGSGVVLRRIFGDVFTLVFQSLMEVYFMVAWLVFYLQQDTRTMLEDHLEEENWKVFLRLPGDTQQN